jgi:hypothetical protein
MSAKVQRQTGFREPDVHKVVRVRRHCHDDEGTIAVMAAVIVPVVLLVIALALASLVWGASETETQRASDQAALQAAASALLVPSAGVAVAPVFPTLNSVIPSALTTGVPGLLSVTTSLSQNATTCKTVGNVYTSVKPLTDLVNVLTAPVLGLPTTAAVTTALNNLNPSVAAALKNPSVAACTNIVVVPDSVLTTRVTACNAAAAAMAEGKAPWSNHFFGGAGSAVPDCDTNGRVTVSLSDDQNNLLDLGGTSVTNPLPVGSQLGNGTSISATSVYNSVQTQLGRLGVRLRTTLPNSLCPKVTVAVDQPVKGPIYDKVATPNGRSTAERVVKNVVIVPVFNGASILTPSAQVSGSISPAADLNADVLAPLQVSLIGALDAVDATINQQLGSTSTVVSGATGAQVGQLDLLRCLRDTVANLYNPPTSSGSAPTSQQLTATMTQTLSDAALTGDPVQIVQVGVRNCSGAATALDIYGGCLAPALGTVTGSSTGLYDVPFLDVTPAIVKSVGGNDFQAVPVAATQADGAFRSVLVRGSADSRFLP